MEAGPQSTQRFEADAELKTDRMDRPGVFLDRDGVLTKALVRRGRPYAPRTLEEFEIVPEAPGELAALKGAGFVLVVVTNQPDLARGLLAAEALDEMHRRLKEALPLDDIVVCACQEQDPACTCYKPRPGMLLDAARRWGIDLGRSFMVGDRWRDVGAGRAAGCRTIFIDCEYEHDRRPDSPDHTVRSLAAAREIILRASAGPTRSL